MKDHWHEVMPAFLRYTGAYFQVLHRVDQSAWPEIVILSADLGYIKGSTPIQDYNQKMRKNRAQQLLLDPGQGAILQELTQGKFKNVLVAAGSLHREVIKYHLAPSLAATAIFTHGRIDEQRSQFKEWLAMVSKEEGRA